MNIEEIASEVAIEIALNNKTRAYILGTISFSGRQQIGEVLILQKQYMEWVREVVKDKLNGHVDDPTRFNQAAVV